MLKGEGRDWWEKMKRSLTMVERSSWRKFQELFEERFLSKHYFRMKEQKIHVGSSKGQQTPKVNI